MIDSRRRVLPLLIAALAAPLSLAGCSGAAEASDPTYAGGACASWVSYRGEPEMLESAATAVEVTVTKEDGTAPYMGVQAVAYAARVDRVLKGSVAEGTSIRVVFAPDTCGDISYGWGDPLTGTAKWRLYLSDENGVYFTLTPAQGALQLGADGAPSGTTSPTP